jgi:class 3 adenylate cyclase
MAELEALAEIRAVPPGSHPGQYTWRRTLPDGRVIRLGSDLSESDWVVPEDKMISRFHATLEWDGDRLAVARRPVSDKFPKPPGNHIWFRNTPVERCEVRPGEWFVIGQTRFAVRGDGEAAPPSPVDATLVRMQVERTRKELESLPFPAAAGEVGSSTHLSKVEVGGDPVSFASPGSLLAGLDGLLSAMRVAADDPALFRNVVRAAMAALPRADAAAVVRVLPSSGAAEARVAVVEQQIRAGAAVADPHGVAGGAAAAFAPSRRLVRRAVLEQRRSCLYVWSTDPGPGGGGEEHTMTTVMRPEHGYSPWAICTPFQDGSDFALYVDGRLSTREAAAGPAEDQLTPYQKFAEILVGLVEGARHALLLNRQNELLQDAWPGALRQRLHDPDRLRDTLRPRETEVTVLFCDLRNYSGFAEDNEGGLTRAWEQIRFALNEMSGAVSERGGIVAGFRGDAVLGFWGWPDKDPGQVEAAALAALKIRERLHGFMIDRRCGLGLTHGTALAGRLGAHDLGVVDLYGPKVNLAFRLEEMTKALGVAIVVSDKVAGRLAEADPDGTRWRVRQAGRVRPRGMKTPLTAFELTKPGVGASAWLERPGPGFRNQLRLWDEAVGWFTAGDWDRARERFQGTFGGDPVADCLLRHMEATKWRPPPGWDGVYVPRPKPDPVSG